MPKSIGTPEHKLVCKLLRAYRERAGLTQEALAARLTHQQPFVSKVESGEIRLDLVQLRAYCLALGTTVTEFVSAFEDELPVV